MNIEIINPWGFIYITTNNVNGKKYIGQKKFIKQWQSYLGSGIALKRAIKKYGRENFSREIIAIGYSKDELNELEIGFIKEHNAVSSCDYYNILLGGKCSSPNLGNHMSEESKLKLSIANSGTNSQCYGKARSDESKSKQGESRKGLKIKLNPEQVEEVRVKYATGKYSLKILAEEYFISSATIGRIIQCIRGYEKLA